MIYEPNSSTRSHVIHAGSEDNNSCQIHQLEFVNKVVAQIQNFSSLIITIEETSHYAKYHLKICNNSALIENGTQTQQRSYS
jgi:hypothetical protein